MDPAALATEAWLERGTVGGVTRIAAHGAWSIDTVASLEGEVAAAPAGVAARAVVDLSGVTHIDTAGAWLIRRLQSDLKAAGATVEEIGTSDNARRLLTAVEVAGEVPPS